MTCTESDDKTSLLKEIREVEEEIANLEKELSYICIRRKLLNHRLADLRWNLSHPSDMV